MLEAYKSRVLLKVAQDHHPEYVPSCLTDPKANIIFCLKIHDHHQHPS